jgi:hypothetical protein
VRRKPKPEEQRPTTQAEWEAIDEVDPLAIADLQVRIATKLRRWEMGGPAVLVLESMKPVSFIASQAMAVGQPFTQALLNNPDVYTFRKLLEDRRKLEGLIQAIEAQEDHRVELTRSERRRRAPSLRRCRIYRAWLHGLSQGQRGIGRGRAKQPRA